jgi:hypothetical protein
MIVFGHAREHREMPVKQGSGIKKSGRVFGQGQKAAKTVRAGLYALVSECATCAYNLEEMGRTRVKDGTWVNCHAA